MKCHFVFLLTGVLWAAIAASAQTPPPAPPAFAAPNLSAAGVRSTAANCAACHGTNGRPAPGSTLVALAAKPKEELALSLKQFKDGSRPATIMHQISKGYSENELGALAEYFSRQSR
jgi:cytochrome c553